LADDASIQNFKKFNKWKNIQRDASVSMDFSNKLSQIVRIVTGEYEL